METNEAKEALFIIQENLEKLTALHSQFDAAISDGHTKKEYRLMRRRDELFETIYEPIAQEFYSLCNPHYQWQKQQLTNAQAKLDKVLQPAQNEYQLETTKANDEYEKIKKQAWAKFQNATQFEREQLEEVSERVRIELKKRVEEIEKSYTPKLQEAKKQIADILQKERFND